MVDVDGYGVEEVFLEDFVVNHGILDVFDPFRGRSDVSPDSCSHIGVGLSQLAPRPHIPIAKEELGPFYSGPDDGRLHCHLQKLV